MQVPHPRTEYLCQRAGSLERLRTLWMHGREGKWKVMEKATLRTEGVMDSLTSTQRPIPFISYPTHFLFVTEAVTNFRDCSKHLYQVNNKSESTGDFLLFLHSHCWVVVSLHGHPGPQAWANRAAILWHRAHHQKDKYSPRQKDNYCSHQPLNALAWK